MFLLAFNGDLFLNSKGQIYKAIARLQIAPKTLCPIQSVDTKGKSGKKRRNLPLRSVLCRSGPNWFYFLIYY